MDRPRRWLMSADQRLASQTSDEPTTTRQEITRKRTLAAAFKLDCLASQELGLARVRDMARITRRKQEAPKRMKYGENGAKTDPLAPQTETESPDQNQDDENESEDESESGKENGTSNPGSPSGDINVVDDDQAEKLEKESRSSVTPDMPVRTSSPRSPATPSGDDRNHEPKWRHEPPNGLVKMETEIMDLSSKRRRSSSDESEPEVKIPRTELKREESQPLDLSQKSSKSSRYEPEVIRHRRPLTPPSSQPLPISPSLASLQKKFGGQVSAPKAPIDVARSNAKSPPATSQARMWYSNVYRQSMAPYAALYPAKLPYYPLDVPLHPSYPALAGNLAVGLMPDLSSLGNAKPPKPAPVSMTTKTHTSITQSPNKNKSMGPKPTTPNGNPHLSPMTSPRGPMAGMASLPFDMKDAAKSNCIDFKCDCGKTYSTLYELSVHMQDTGHMPRNTKAGPSGDYPKLVRGQDMWLNNGLEQTKQILRCMHCGESFKTLPELTVHMMKTQHYADIFSSAHRKMHKCTTFFEKESDTKSVFKCRVCETEYESLDSLANHMVESRHHKRSNSRCADDPVKVRQSLLATMGREEDCDSRSDTTPPLVSPGIKPDPDPAFHDRRRQHKPDTKPVIQDKPPPSVPAHNGDVNHNTDKDSRSSMTSPASDRDVTQNGRATPTSDNEEEEEHDIKCENCFERIKRDLFVEHVRHCISKDRKMTSSKPVVTSLPSPPPLERSETRPKSGSALKAMEQFIENFNDRKPHKAQAPMSSLLYDYVGPLGQKTMNGERSPVDKSRPYYERGDQSALHNLYRFTSYGPQQRLPPRESPSRSTVSRSPLPSPKHSSPRSSPLGDVTRQDDVIRRPDDVIRRDDVISPRKEELRKSVSPAAESRESPSPAHRSDRGSISSPSDGYHSNEPESSKDDKNFLKNALPNGCVSPHASSTKSTDSPPPNGKTSALASLRGLVDKQLDKSEHPLNSLQKLINQTDGNHSDSVASLQSRLINVTSSPYWFSFSHLTRGWQGKDTPGNSGPGAGPPGNPGNPDRDENRSVVDSDGVEVKVSDLKCDVCGKLFSSRGGCRYHRSKCVLSNSQKPSGSKEAQIVQTPYTYMPLEHTNKFSKYYEMARELANKSN